MRVLISSPAGRPVATVFDHLPWSGRSVCQIRMVDAQRDLEPAGEVRLEGGEQPRVEVHGTGPFVCLLDVRAAVAR